MELAGFVLERISGTAGFFHERHSVPPSARTVTLCVLEKDALVLGSIQKADDTLTRWCADFGFDLVRRRSGGTAVVVPAGEQVWIDVGLPAHDPLILPDIGRSFNFVAKAWGAALAGLGFQGLTIKGAGMERASGLEQVCFAGKGPGEIILAGRKLVGMAQRRSGRGANFHTMAYRHFPYALTSAALIKNSEFAKSRLHDLVIGLDEANPSGLGLPSGEVVVEAVATYLDRL